MAIKIKYSSVILILADGEEHKALITGKEIVLAALDPGLHPLSYDFIGWSYSEDGEVIATPTIPLVDNLQLFAIWDEKQIKAITYTMELEPNIVMIAGIEGDLTLPTRAEKLLKGWSLTPDGEILEGPTYHPLKDETLYAVWEDGVAGKLFIVSFDKTDGEGFMPAVACGKDFTIPECEFTPPAGEVFDHWQFSEDTSETHYAPGDVVTLDDALDNYILVAYWRVANAFNVTYWRNQTAVDTKTVTYTHVPGLCVFATNQFPEVEKTFLGWSIDRNETIGTKDGNFNLTGNIDWYAIWGE